MERHEVNWIIALNCVHPVHLNIICCCTVALKTVLYNTMLYKEFGKRCYMKSCWPAPSWLLTPAVTNTSHKPDVLLLLATKCHCCLCNLSLHMCRTASALRETKLGGALPSRWLLGYTDTDSAVIYAGEAATVGQALHSASCPVELPAAVRHKFQYCVIMMCLSTFCLHSMMTYWVHERL